MALKWMTEPLNTMSNGAALFRLALCSNWHSYNMNNMAGCCLFLCPSIPQFWANHFRSVHSVFRWDAIRQFSMKKLAREKNWRYTKQSIINWNGHVIKMVKLDKLHHFHSSGYDAFHSPSRMLSLYSCGVDVSMRQLKQFIQEKILFRF